ELLDLADRIGRDAEHDGAGPLVILAVITNPARLGRTAGRERLRIEVEDHALAAQVRQRNGLAMLVRESEVGGHRACFERHGCYFSSRERRRSFITLPPVW